jgi:succinoglycan biosynthesis transport protein ExoP
MPSINDTRANDDAVHQVNGILQPEVADLVGIARRGWLWLVAGTAVGLICAKFLLSVMPPVYKASSRIVFERTLPRYMQTNRVTNEPIIEDYDTLGQTYVISSESIILQVVRSLSLANEPDFVRGKDQEKTLGSRVQTLFRATAQALGLPDEPAKNQSIDPHDVSEKIAFANVLRDLTVTREDVASVITIAYSSKDPVKAATIVNAIVDTYIEHNLAGKVASTGLAGKVVQERVEELKQQAEAAERAIQEYKVANNLIGGDQKTMSHAQLNTLHTSITTARLAMAEARAKMQRVASDPDAVSLFTPDNDLIIKLRAELLDLSVRANDIERRVGKDHQAVVKIRTRMKEALETIANEQRRVAGTFAKEYEIARSRYDELSDTVSKALDEEQNYWGIAARLKELQNAAETLQGMHARMLQHSNDISRVDAQPSIKPDARVLSRAIPPLEPEASKKRLLILGGGSVMGLFLGAAFVLFRTFPFGVFRSSRQVTDATGLPCVVLPEIVDADEQSFLETGEYVLDRPYSRFTQALRGIGPMIDIAPSESGAKVVCVVSANPGEGKSTVAVNLAAHFARHASRRVLVIDADFYRQSLTKRLACDARVGLSEALEDPRALPKFVVRKERLNLDVLPCPLVDRISNAAELLGTAGMKQLIEVARGTYDLVIIEAPPMAAVVDFKLIAQLIHGFIFVVEWGKTSQRLVFECLSDASTVLDRALCIVLNKADLSALRTIEHYKGDGFHSYYSDQKAA